MMLALAAASAFTAVARDEVTALPGWNKPLPSKHYSGYLNIDDTNGKALHYYFVEAHNNSATAPVLLWMNGGPGCSSMDGLFYEHGPLLVADDGQSLIQNPYAWSTLANVLYLEAPAGVGFSYSNTSSDYKTGDNKTAYDNFAALKVFFRNYPEYSSNDFYISGESYGGVYVPTLSYTIFTHQDEMNFNMKGFLVGNGVFGECSEEAKLATDTHIEFLHGHGMISQKLYNQVAAACRDDRSSSECQSMENKAAALGEDTNPYDAYRTCYHHKTALTVRPSHKNPASLRALYTLPRPAHPALAGLKEQVPCIDSTGGTVYLTRPDVIKAMHVEASPNKWQICSDIVQYGEDGVYAAGMVPLYKQMSPHWRVVVYNGDVDPGCSYVMNEACVTSIGKKVKNDWRAWYYNDAEFGRQVAGYTTQYEGDLNFITIHGAGHMSPQWKPAQAHTMLQRFLSHTPF